MIRTSVTADYCGGKNLHSSFEKKCYFLDWKILKINNCQWYNIHWRLVIFRVFSHHTNKSLSNYLIILRLISDTPSPTPRWRGRHPTGEIIVPPLLGNKCSQGCHSFKFSTPITVKFRDGSHTSVWSKI